MDGDVDCGVVVGVGDGPLVAVVDVGVGVFGVFDVVAGGVAPSVIAHGWFVSAGV